MFFGMSFPFLGRGIGGLGDMNNKFLPTETSAPFSCNPWVVFLLIVCFGVVGFFSFIYQQSFFFSLLISGYFLSVAVPSALAPTRQQFWLSELFSVWPGRRHRSDLYWNSCLM